MGALSAAQVANLIIIERTTASLSVFSTFFLFLTFALFPEFRTLSNTLIFYASFANLGANVAALIGGSALSQTSGGLCQFQGFMLEMFMQSDPMWSLAMAANVYLVFFRRFDAVRLKRMYYYYAALCYGIPFIPAMICLFLKTKTKGSIYGNATLWCWIDNDWAPLRIYTYYAPVWFCIIGALIIYTRVGFEIFQKRTQLKAAANATETYSGPEPSTDHSSPFTGMRTTEIEVTHVASYPAYPAATYNKQGRKDNNYSVTISAPQSQAHRAPTAVPKRSNSLDKIKVAYCKVALLFAISILITWVPATANRGYGLVHPKDPSYALNVASAIVLPLQGFWNTVIYFVTSLTICHSRWASIKKRKEDAGFTRLATLNLSRREPKCSSGESTMELSANRSIERDDSSSSLTR